MNNELCVDAAALAVDGTEPDVGDQVTLQQVTGTVSRKEGGKLYVKATEADGQPLAERESAAEEAGEATEDDLRAMAEGAPPIL